ncbi:alanine racemase [Agrobacterium larrymoorei]|uniref:Alanine racemase n=1 Tax=Agrobacterium larrymoorei TaxID=160699 RepID=A0AAF0HAN5_9HYPH|nr:alanine racemase [Agrobacterium larrymoorei]WHA42593.1 alanine racemase [Agrobacterium larrymoorei]
MTDAVTDKDYFERASIALREAGLHHPVVFIDLDRLDANIDVIRQRLAKGPPIRVVDKSLPSIPLLRHIMTRCQTSRTMSFHLPMTLEVLSAFPDAEVLFGKPLPVATLSSCLRTASPDVFQDLLRRSIFLIDTFDRLEQYAAFASQSHAPLRVAFEVDVGMHRGGFDTVQALASAVARAEAAPEMIIEGVMAYDAHIPQIPKFAGGAMEKARVDARLAGFVNALPSSARQIINTGGSKTAFGHTPKGRANEVSIGSAFVKPMDFDIAPLSQLQAATFIATPILKVCKMRLPGPPMLTNIMQMLGLFPRQGCFLYGGKWMAHPVHPAKLKENRIWGTSSNQQMMAMPRNCTAKADDFAFFRPTQSEAVLQSLDGIYVMSEFKIQQRWETVPLSRDCRDECTANWLPQ